MIVKSKMWLGREASCRLRRGSSVLLVMILLLTVWLFVVFVWLLFGFWLIVLIDCVCKRRRRTEKCFKLSHRELKKCFGKCEGERVFSWRVERRVDWVKLSYDISRPFKSRFSFHGWHEEMKITDSIHELITAKRRRKREITQPLRASSSSSACESSKLSGVKS